MPSTTPVKTPEFIATDVLAPGFWAGRAEKQALGIDVSCTKIAVDLQSLTREGTEATL